MSTPEPLTEHPQVTVDLPDDHSDDGNSRVELDKGTGNATGVEPVDSTY